MNKILFFACFGLFAAALALKIEKKHEINPRMFENEVNQTIQDILAGLPEPIEIESYELTLPEDSPLTGTASITGLTLSGIKGLQIAKLSIGLLMDVDLTAVLPSVSLKTGYKADLFYETTAVYGEGDADVTLQDIEVVAHFHLVLDSPPQITDTKVTLTLGGGTFAITGIFNNETLSADISQSLTDNAANFINDNEDVISETVSPIVEQVINAVLAALLGGKKY